MLPDCNLKLLIFRETKAYAKFANGEKLSMSQNKVHNHFGKVFTKTTSKQGMVKIKYESCTPFNKNCKKINIKEEENDKNEI